MQRPVPVGLSIALLVALVLAGCAGGPAGGGEGPGGDSSGGDRDTDAAALPLRFVREDRPSVEENFTLTVSPLDACLPAACVLYSAAGSGVPSFIKPIDLTHLLPPGTHASVEATAQWDATNPPLLIGGMNLQWFSFDIWTTQYQAGAAPGEATLSSHVTNHGPAPAQMILVVLEPEGMHEDVEVTVHVRVTYLDDAVHATHVVAASLAGGAVPIQVGLGEGDGSAILHVRGPDDEAVLTVEVTADQEPVRLPADSPRGEYLFVTFEHDAPARILVPAANLTAPLIRAVDTTGEPGRYEAVPAQGTMTWTETLDWPPYWVGLYFDALDGRSTWISASVRVTAPDGTTVVGSSLACSLCLYSFLGARSALAGDALTAGEYTFEVTVEEAQGWRVAPVVGAYGR